MSGRPFRLGVLLLATTAGFSQAQSLSKMVLTSKVDGLEPEASFTCDGSIYGYLTLAEASTGKHELEGIWIMPNGHVTQHSHSMIDFGAEPASTAQLWLQFQPEAHGLSALTGSGAAYVHEPDYAGEWHLSVLWDHQFLTKASFQVRC